MKHEMKSSQPDVTLRKCRDDFELGQAARVAVTFIHDYEGLPREDCIYGTQDGASYYAKCTRSGNVVVERV